MRQEEVSTKKCSILSKYSDYTLSKLIAEVRLSCGLVNIISFYVVPDLADDACEGQEVGGTQMNYSGMGSGGGKTDDTSQNKHGQISKSQAVEETGQYLCVIDRWSVWKGKDRC